MAKRAAKIPDLTIAATGEATNLRDAARIPPVQTGAGGSPPDNPMLEKRVEILEADMKDVKASLGRLEVGFVRFEEKLNAIANTMATKEDLVRLELSTKQQIADLELKSKQEFARIELTTKQEFARIELTTKQEFARLEKDVARIDGKISQIPTIWQIVAIIATLMISLSGLFYTANNAVSLFQKAPAAPSISQPTSQPVPSK